jgi:uncharacterized protein YqeY
MGELEDRLRNDLTQAIRTRDQVSAATLRMALTSIKNQSVSGEVARELGDDEVVQVLGREAKRRRESAQAYDDAGRADLADRERAELAVLAGYLPTPLTDAELTELVSAAMADAGVGAQDGMSAMGKVMKVLTPRVAGRADGSRVAAAVKAALT